MDNYGLTQEELNGLSAEFPPEALDSYKGFTYISIEHVIERLNQVFNANWNCKLVHVSSGQGETKTSKSGNNYTVTPVYVGVELTVTSRTGASITRLGFGGNNEGFGNSDGDGYKAAYSDALKKAAQSLGVGLYISKQAREKRKGSNYGGGGGYNQRRSFSPPGQAPNQYNNSNPGRQSTGPAIPIPQFNKPRG